LPEVLPQAGSGMCPQTRKKLSKRNIKLILEFEGTDFHGWQIQKDARTVQGVVTDALRLGLKQDDLHIIGCSRTDAGVHAERYCANFHTDTKFSLETIKGIANTRLPDDVKAVDAEETDNDFHARHSAKGKQYRYRINTSKEYRPLLRRFSWHVPYDLNCEVMQQTGHCLEGEHDFTAFSGALEPGKSPVRTIESVTVSRDNDEITIEVTGRSFLYKMVRIITGTLADVGRGSISADDVKKILDSKDKSNIRVAAPAHGLTLVEVKY
jgi:tRNA pseudouridine38-40 synthase